MVQSEIYNDWMEYIVESRSLMDSQQVRNFYTGRYRVMPSDRNSLKIDTFREAITSELMIYILYLSVIVHNSDLCCNQRHCFFVVIQILDLFFRTSVVFVWLIFSCVTI